MLSAILLLLALAPTLAQTPPPAATPKPVDPFAAGLIQPLPLEPALLRRWGYDVEKVLALPPAKRLELQKELTLLEIGRLRRLELLKKLRPDDWRTFVDANELLTPDGMKLVDVYLAKLGDKPMLVPAQVSDLTRKDGKPLSPEDRARLTLALDKLFDGVADHKDADSLGHEIIVDARVRNETLYSMTLTNPRTGLAVEVGQLYVDGRHPQAANSQYVNLMGAWESKPDSWVDYRFKAQLGYVDLRARYFADGQDPRVGRMLELGQSLGVPQAQIDQAARYITYDDPYKAHGLIVTSLLSEIGRAYNLYGPLDLVWTAGNLTKIAWLAPNTAFDETLGLRVRLNKDLSLGFFGGAVENISPVGNNLLQEAMRTETIKPGFNMEVAPHASAALWGKVPGVSDLSFSIRGTERMNQTTNVHEGEVALMTTFQDHPLALRGIYSLEQGKGIEYRDEKLGAQLDYQLSDRIQAYLSYDRRHVKYGNANVDSDAFMIGIEMTLGGGNSAAAGSVAVEHLFGGEYRGRADPMRPYLQETLTKVNRDIVAGLNVADRASALYQRLRPDLGQAQLEGDLNALSLALQRLDPSTAGQLIDQLGRANLSDAQKQFLSNAWLRTVSQGSSYYNDIRGRLAQSLGGDNVESELFWRQSQAAARLQQALGVTLSPAQQGQLGDFLSRVSQAARDAGTLTPDQIRRIDDQGLALLGPMNQRLTQIERQQLTNLITQQARDLGAYLQAHKGELAGGAERILKKIDDVNAYYQQHKAEIRELAALLTNEQVWDAVIIQAGRAQLIEAMAKIGKVNIKIPAIGDVDIQIDAPAILAASNILQSRLSPLAPARASDVDRFLLREGAKSLGMDPNSTDQQFIAGLFGTANDQLKQQLSSRLGPLLDNGRYDPAALSQKILAAVPPQAAQYLQQQYGVDLKGLLTPNMTRDQLKTLLTTTLPDKLTDFLNRQYGPQLAQGLAAATSWAGELLSRQINMTLIQMMLASEELNRLSVDHGRKINDLDLRFAMRSFDMLDARERPRAVNRLKDVKARLAEEAGNQEARLIDRVKAQAKAQLQSLQLDPSWPEGLRVSIPDESLAPLFNYYGDGEVFALLDRVRTAYLAKPHPKGINLTLEFDKDNRFGPHAGAAIWRSKGSPDIKIQLPKPSDPRDAAFKLKYLEDYVNGD